MPGPEVHLNMINALLHHAFLRELPPWTGDLLIALAVVMAWLLTILLKKTWLRGVAFVLLGAAFLFSVKLSYDYGNTVVLGIPPFLAFGVAGLVSFVYDFTHETLEKLRIRRTLEAYVSKDVVREVLDNPQSYLSKLGGQRENVALIVTDLRGFTTMSEEMDSHQLVAQLNEYLSLMVDDIFSRRGSVDKFIGDAILAVWGHVKSEGPAQDATLAIEAALLMKDSLRRLNADWESRGLKTFQMGIGINFGEVIFGNIGSSRKMEPTVIGDAVNTASRLEGLTKDYGRDLLVGEAVADLVKDTFRLQFIDKVHDERQNETGPDLFRRIAEPTRRSNRKWQLISKPTKGAGQLFRGQLQGGRSAVRGLPAILARRLTPAKLHATLHRGSWSGRPKECGRESTSPSTNERQPGADSTTSVRIQRTRSQFSSRDPWCVAHDSMPA